MKKTILLICIAAFTSIIYAQIPSSQLFHSIGYDGVEFIVSASNRINAFESDSVKGFRFSSPVLLGIGYKYIYLYGFEKAGLLFAPPIFVAEHIYAGPYFSTSFLIERTSGFVLIVPIMRFIKLYADVEAGFQCTYQVENIRVGMIGAVSSSNFRDEEYYSGKSLLLFSRYRMHFGSVDIDLSTDYEFVNKSISINITLIKRLFEK